MQLRTYILYTLGRGYNYADMQVCTCAVHYLSAVCAFYLGSCLWGKCEKCFLSASKMSKGEANWERRKGNWK